MASVDVSALNGQTATQTTIISPDRAILYALGVGAKRSELDVVYEGDSSFLVLPTMGVIPAFDVMWAGRWREALPDFDPVREG